MTNHDRITKEFGKRWADMVFGKGEFERRNLCGIPTWHEREEARKKDLARSRPIDYKTPEQLEREHVRLKAARKAAFNSRERT